MKRLKLNAGFTLIELMIVIAIVSVLTIIAVPAYHNYIARSQVTEIFTLLEGMKTAIADTYQSTADITDADNGTGMIPLANEVSGKWVDNVVINDGVIAARLSANASALVANGVVQISPITHQGSMEWTCSAGTTVDTRYLPRACRDSIP